MTFRTTHPLAVENTLSIVTGGGSGIGRGIAESLIAAGSRVVIADIEDDVAQQTAAEIGATALHLDVADAASFQALAETVLADHGEPDILVNNAGVGSMGRIARLTLEDWRWMIEVNLFGVIHGIHTFLPLLSARPGGAFIVNTASMAGLTTNPGVNQGSYTAAKMGIVGISEVLDRELKEDGLPVGVSVLCPGPVHSRIKDSLRSRPGDTAPGGLFDVDASKIGALAEMRWMTAREAGDLVVEAIREGRPYVITHPELWGVVGERFADIADAFDVDVSWQERERSGDE